MMISLSERPLMTCGCVAQGICSGLAGVKIDPIPVCVVHNCYTIAPSKPNLTGRTARCYCKRDPVSSSYDLAFFEYLGENSREATEICTCGYAESAHGLERKPHLKHMCDNFTPKGANQFDRYYCGCRGWD